jgi:L-asparaginase
MQELSLLINEKLEDETIAGIVITHGTDSLEETAYFLNLTIDSDKPVIVTGSQRSLSDVGSDVYSNLRNSIICATDEHMQNTGVTVVFNERIYSARYIKKIHSSNLQGFDSLGRGYLGIVDNDTVYLYQKPIKEKTLNVKNVSIPYVDIIKTFAGQNGMLFEFLLGKDIKGIVIEGSGRGQAAASISDILSKNTNHNTKIVIATSTTEGRVYPTYDYKGSANDLLSKGCIMGGDLDSKKARIKLALLLANEIEDIEMYF